MKLYTKKGDTGTTGILGKDRLAKDDTRIEAYGTIDELNSILGMTNHHVQEEFHEAIQIIQAMLFEIGTELASTDIKNIVTEDDVNQLEGLIDHATAKTAPLTSFILPGGSQGASWLHIARTVCRRAERRVVGLSHEVQFNKFIIPYLNRLSDLFFVWARLENQLSDVDDIAWEPRK